MKRYVVSWWPHSRMYMWRIFDKSIKNLKDHCCLSRNYFPKINIETWHCELYNSCLSTFLWSIIILKLGLLMIRIMNFCHFWLSSLLHSSPLSILMKWVMSLCQCIVEHNLSSAPNKVTSYISQKRMRKALVDIVSMNTPSNRHK